MKKLSTDAEWALTELRRRNVLTGCTSYVQRKLQIGFVKAARLLDELVEAGWISEPDNTGGRRWVKRPALQPCPGCDGHECDERCAYPGAALSSC